MPYIDWAVANDYGVLDINFPQFYSVENDAYARQALESELQQQTKELLCYLWDNYIELMLSASVTLMGVGDAYTGIKQLLTSRGKSTCFIYCTKSLKQSTLCCCMHIYHLCPFSYR